MNIFGYHRSQVQQVQEHARIQDERARRKLSEQDARLDMIELNTRRQTRDYDFGDRHHLPDRPDASHGPHPA